MNSCEYCEELFEPLKYNQKYCSRDCYSEMNSMRSLARYYNDPEYKEKMVERQPHAQRMHHFGISMEKYIEILESQDSRCAICGRHQEELDRKMAVDHSHSNGHIRGLLCLNCNTGIGNLRDSVELLEKAQKYLLEKGE
jgi:hypothetical protein